jgi:hypothetical protein
MLPSLFGCCAVLVVFVVIMCVLMAAIIGVLSDAISRLGFMSKELCDSPLKIEKSSRSGVLLISVGH